MRPNSSGHRCRRRPRFKKLEKHLRRPRCTTLFVLLLLLVLSIAVLVLDAIQYSKPTHWSASYRESPRSTIGIAAVQTAIEYEYRFTEYRFAEYEYDEIRREPRTLAITEPEPETYPSVDPCKSGFGASVCSSVI